MPEQPSVSVVIPVHNGSSFIAQALESVMRQTLQPTEVIVVDDGSDDERDLLAALEPFRERVQCIRQANGGPGSARNTGIARARGRLVAFLDADDSWLPHFLASQLPFLAREEADLVYADALLVGDSPEAGRTLMDLSPSRGKVTFESLVRGDCSLITSCVVAKRQSLVDAGLFDPSLFHSEDFDLWLRLLHHGGQISYQTEVLARHRSHGGSLTARRGVLLDSQALVCAKLLRELPLTVEEEGLLRRRIEWATAHRAVLDAKASLVQGRYPAARQELRSAVAVLGNWKLRAALLAIRVAPGLVRRLYVRLRPWSTG